MSARLPLAAACLGALALAACDAATETPGGVDLNDDDRVSGVWETTVPFSIDTVLAEHNYRIRADYDVLLRFDVLHDDGLAWGTVTAAFDGTMIAREAGTLADTFALRPEATTITAAAYGTFIRPTFELDVPFGPYTEDLWTFEKVAGRMDLGTQIVHNWAFTRRHVAEPDTFDFVLPMLPDVVSIERQDGETPNVPEPTTPTQIPGSAAPAGDPLFRVRAGASEAALRRMGPAR